MRSNICYSNFYFFVQHCLRKFGKHHKFIGFIDLDEFIVIMDQSLRDVNQLLEQYEQVRCARNKLLIG